MSETNYTYAVARVRAKEVSLFSDSVIEQLMACKDYKSCMAFFMIMVGEMENRRKQKMICLHLRERKPGMTYMS